MLLGAAVRAAFLAPGVSSEDAAAPLVQVAALALPNVEGRIDHLAIDLQGKRLFVCALGSNEVEVVGLDSGSVIHRIGGLSEPQGVCYVPETNRIYITNAGRGQCDLYRQIARLATAAGGRTSLWVAEMDRLFVAIPRRGSKSAEIRVYRGSG